MNEKNYEGLGYLFGSIIGAIATGICVYYTKSVFAGAREFSIFFMRFLA